MMGPVVQLASSNLESVRYDDAAQVLEVTFKNGGTFSYQNVSAELYAGLIAAPSIGKFFHANIRNRHQAARV
jgi:hypothetical protein